MNKKSGYFKMFNCFTYVFWKRSQFKTVVCKEEGSQVCLKDRRPCSGLLTTEGREGFSKMEDRRWDIPDSCPDVYKSPSPWILLRLTTIISAGMSQNGIWRGDMDEMGEDYGPGGRKWELGSRERKTVKKGEWTRVITEVWMRRVKEGGCHSMPWPPHALLLPAFLSRGESIHHIICHLGIQAPV